MSATLHIQLVTPQQKVLSEEVTSLSCPTTEGQITILPGHAELIATLVSGELIARTALEAHFIHVAGGFVQVTANNEVILLADSAEHFYEIDIERAEQAKRDAEKMLAEQKLSNEEYAVTAHVLQKNLSRIRIARKHAHKRKNFSSEGILS